MRFGLEAFSALEGDALLIHYRAGNQRRYALIDGGPAHVFESSVQPILERYGKKDAHGLPLAFVAVSHVDDDHIVGVLDLFATFGSGHPPAFTESLFHNTPAAGVRGGRTAAIEAAVDGLVQAFEAGGVRVATYEKGEQLADSARDEQIEINPPDGRRLVAGDTLPEDKVGPLSCTVVAPTIKQLEAMIAKWKAKVPGKVKPARIERSLTNLSSLVLLVEFKTKTMLLTGDARADHILDGLEVAGHPATVEEPLHVDLLKVPHHGSDRNVINTGKKDWHFFDRVLADHYVISANGRYDNPSVETLKLIVAANRDRACTIWLTTRTDTVGKYSKPYGTAVAALQQAIKKSKAAHIDLQCPAVGATSVLVPLID